MASALTNLQDVWTRLSGKGKIATIGGAVASLGLLGALIYYGYQPDYRVLFSDLKPAEAQTIVEKLKTANVPYTLSNGGTTIQVPNERIPELRIQMASEGALNGGHVGFDLFDKTNFGATDFAQQVNYHRALEGELSKTLEGMDEIESARVHVTPKKESVFSEKEEGAKASVMVRVRQNKELSNERAEAIVSLVASSIEGLDPSGVSVMDTRGRLLVAAGRGKDSKATDAGAFQAQLEARRKFESESAARVIALLEPVVGDNRVRADIAADIDFSQIEQSEEKYSPQSQVVRSQQTAQETRGTTSLNAANATNATGVAGARSNNPATLPTPAAPAQVANPATPAGEQRNTSTVNYEIDKTIRKTLGGGGRVNRLTVSVVVDNKIVEGVEVARTTDEMKQIQDLVGAAVGIDANRGDSVVVQTMAFSKPAAENLATTSFLDRNKQLVSNAPKYIALVIVALLLILFVVRPAHRAIRAASIQYEEQKLLSDGSESSDQKQRQLGGNTRSNMDPMTVAEIEEQMKNGGYAQPNKETERVEAIRKQIATQTLNEPETVVSTIRGWIRESA
jgi:flagellar M-ring protein FliF